MNPLLVGLLALLSAMLLARRFANDSRFELTSVLAGRSAPWIIGALTAIICGYVWGHLQPTAVVHDEASYLLQARIFAHGAFAMPAPPLPEFFEQFHTYVTPAFASKYPPGHALLLALGVAVGWAALIPLLLDGLSGALIFLLARRIANPWVGLLTWMIWLTAAATFHHIASYFSQSTSTFLWLLGWWALLCWREQGRTRWLLVLSACVGWLAITRPLTAVAYALPMAVVVVVLGTRRRAFRDMAYAIAVSAAILLLIPYANQRTTGDWKVMPYSEYSKIYFPFDAPGFGVDSTPPRRALPPDMVQFGLIFRPVHQGYEPRVLPGTLVSRIWFAARELWRGPRILLGIAALAAIPLVGAEVGFALVTTLTLFVLYLSYAHSPFWTIYYAETLPVFAAMSALGIWWLLTGERRAGREGPRRVGNGPALAACALCVLYLPIAVKDWQDWRAGRIAEQSYQRAVAKAVASIPEKRVIVFMRYAKWHNIHTSLIANDPDLAASHAWLVYDRGADNVRLQRIAPDRVPYIYDEAHLTLNRYLGPSSAATQ